MKKNLSRKTKKINKFIVNEGKKTLSFFDIEKSKLISLNETATVIYKKIKKGIGTDEIAVFLSDKYSVSRDKAVKDVKETKALIDRYELCS